MSRRRIGDVVRDLAAAQREAAALFEELASITDSEAFGEGKDKEAPRKRKAPAIVRPAGESDDLSKRRAAQLLERNGLVRR